MHGAISVFATSLADKLDLFTNYIELHGTEISLQFNMNLCVDYN